MTTAELAKESRLKCLDLLFAAQTSHIGSLLGAADIFAVLFENMEDEDIFVLSAGWKAALLYFHLWKKGKITTEELESYCQDGSKFIGLAEPIIPEIPIAGGSMGLGLPGAVGIALAKKLKGEEGRVYCLMSDGEMAIGTTWESALIAAMHKLDNLYVIVDVNDFQAMGKTEEIVKLDPLWEKWESFNWVSQEVDGHDFGELERALEYKTDSPQVLLAQTIKGKGWKHAEGNNLYHYKALSPQEYKEAKRDIKHG